MKKRMMLIAIVIVIVVLLTRCGIVGFFIDTSSQYVRRARKYIAQKYDGMAVEHVMVRYGNKNGYVSAGYYYTHWKTVNEPVVEFRVQEALSDFKPTGKKKGDKADEYKIVLIELEMKKRAEEYFNRYLTEPYLIEFEVTGRDGYYTFIPKDEYLDLDKYLELTLNSNETNDWNTEIGIMVGYDDAKNISAEEMYLICKGLNDSRILGYAPLIHVEVDKFEYVQDEEGNKIIKEPYFGVNGTTFPNERYKGVETSEEDLISKYNYCLERIVNK